MNEAPGAFLTPEMEANLKELAATQTQVSEGARVVHEAATKNINRIFEYAMQRITAARQGLDALEMALNAKREGLNKSLDGYALALDTIEKQTNDMQKAVGEVMAAQDNIV